MNEVDENIYNRRRREERGRGEPITN